MKQMFLGFERVDGSVGIRNVIAVVSVMDTCNPVTRAIAQAVQGTIYLPGSYIRGQLSKDRQITLRVTAGLCLNPNVAGVVVIGLEPETTRELADLIRPSGKPVESVDIQLVGGTIKAIADGTRVASLMVRAASRQVRSKFPLSHLRVGLECGGSDTTSGLASNPVIGRVADQIVKEGGQAIITETSEFFGAEHLFAERAVSAAVKERFLHEVLSLEQAIISLGVDLRGSNPSPDNIRGGLTTIEEKALGAMAKAGSSTLVDVLNYGEPPAQPGLHFMAGPAPAVESLTGLAATGCQFCLFSTGVGNPVGHPVMPVLKLSGNRKTLESFFDNIDFDVSDVIEKGESPIDAGARLLRYALSVAGGELTSSEVLDTRESAISRFGISM